MYSRRLPHSYAMSTSKPKPMVAANWKCNGKMGFAKELLGHFNDAKITHEVDCIVAPSYLHIGLVQSLLTNSKFQVAAQNSIPKSGAFTGEVSLEMLKDAGVNWIIAGHSERRTYYNETNEIVGSKVQAAVGAGFSAIACIGETLREREDGRTAIVVVAQLAAIASMLRESEWSRVVIAYEPVWAIGTGRTASPDQAQEVHAVLRAWLRNHYPAYVADQVRVLYGGSVKPGNAAELLSCPDIDGALVGGASLKADSFAAIVHAA